MNAIKNVFISALQLKTFYRFCLHKFFVLELLINKFTKVNKQNDFLFLKLNKKFYRQIIRSKKHRLCAKLVQVFLNYS